ncbi:MAG: lysyl oxidase family protein [Phycisphaerales bacterium]
MSAFIATSAYAGVPAAPLLPDLFAWEDQAKGYMYDGFFDTTTEPGKALYRFSAVIPNIGDGPFEVFEVTHPNNTQDVYQNIYDSLGGMTQTLMGSFPDADPAFGHLFLVGLAQYNLREVLPGNGVGDVVASTDKTSFGLVDSLAYNKNLPGAPQTRVYNSANINPVGVSVGWADYYHYSLPKQWIDATGLPDGQYWLEVVIDPYNMVQETNETNNTTRVLVNLTIPQAQLPGDLNGDGFVGIADLNIVLGNWNQGVDAGVWGLGDPTGDGFVGIADLNQVLGNWNAGTPPLSNTNIPEPGTGLILLGWCALMYRKHA